MTTTVTPPARTLRPPRKARSNGQWALDGRKPLNDNEAFKQDGDPLAVRDRIMHIYGPGGYKTIAPDDLHGRFRWWGLYTQRKQGIDGGRTAQLDASELSDRYFMQRVRLDGGSLSREQLQVLGSVSNDFARGTADITDRQNIQLHWVEIDNVPELWRRLESVGLTTVEGCGDTPRGFLVSPVAGIAKDEVIDPTPLARAIKDTYLGDPELAICPASSRRPSPAPPVSTSSTRSTMSPSWASTTPSSVPATTCGWPGPCRPPRVWARGWAPSSRLRMFSTSGTASSASSATTATVACATRPV